MKSVVSLCSLLVLAGCASAPSESVATRGDMVCERYYPTGSNIATLRCYTADDRQQQQQAVDDMRNAISRTSTKTGAVRTGQ